MDLGSVYMNKNKHSRDLEIASLHKALHDLQSYIHLILRIIGGLAGFTSDHLSSELMSELSKMSHDSTVQVLFPYKSSSTKTMTSVPQSYYMDSKDGDYSASFNVGVNDSSWNGIHYSTFFSNLAKTLPASSATDCRESHQLGLNQVVRPNPRKPPKSLFATYNPSRKQVKHMRDPETKTNTNSIEINQPINVKAYRSDFNNGNNHDKFYVSSGNETDYEALVKRNQIHVQSSFAKSKETTQTRHILNTVGDRETDVLSKECSRKHRLEMNSLSVQNHLDPSTTTAVEVGQIMQRNRSTERARKRLSSETNSGSDQTKSLTYSQESLNSSGDLVTPENRAGSAQLSLRSVADYASDPIAIFSKDNASIKTGQEHTQSPNIIKLLKTAAINEKDVSNLSQMKIVESNHDPSTLTFTQELFATQQEKKSFNVTVPSKISLVDITLLQKNVSNEKPDKMPFSRTGKGIDRENCLIFSKKLNCEHEGVDIIASPNITDRPLASVVEKENEGKDATIETQVKKVQCNGESDPAAFLNTPKSLSCENADQELSPPQINIDQSKALVTKQQMDQMKVDGSRKPMVSAPVSVSDPPKCLIAPVEPSNMENNNVHSPLLNITGLSLISTVQINEVKDTMAITHVKPGGCNNENDPAAFLNTALDSLSHESDNKDFSLTPSVLELLKPSGPKKTIDQKMEEDMSVGKTKFQLSSIPVHASDHDPTCKFDRRIEVANLTAKEWLNRRGCLNKQPELDVPLNTKKDLTSNKYSEPPWKFDTASSNPNVYENIKEECIKYNSANGASLEEILPARPALHLKLPDMPDLINDSDSLRLQNSLSKINEDFMNLMNMKFASKVVKNTRSLESQSPEFPGLDSPSADKCKDLIPSNNPHEEVDVNKPFNLGIESETSKKTTLDKCSEPLLEYEDTSDTNLSDDDSEGKLVIDIPDAELTHKPSPERRDSKEGFNHPKKNWRIKMLQDDKQVDSHKNINIEALRQLKAPSSIIGQELLHLRQDLVSDISADFTINQIRNKPTPETAPLLIGPLDGQSGEVRSSTAKQIGSTLLSAGDKGAFKNVSSDISSNDNTNATEVLHNRLKHLPVEIQRGLKKRNETLMKYFNTVYPNSHLQGKSSADSFYRKKDTDVRLSKVGRSFASDILDNSARVVDEETENDMMLGLKIKQGEPDEGALDFSGAHVKNKTVDSATYNPELGLNLQLAEDNAEDRTIDSDKSFLSYILRGYNMSGEEGASQSVSDLRKINDSYLFPLGNIGQHSLARITGDNVREQDYTPKEKRRKTNADLNFDTDHRKRREKNNEASKRHRESKKKLQKEAFDNIKNLEETNLRLRRKAEKLDSAVKQVLKVITKLSSNS